MIRANDFDEAMEIIKKFSNEINGQEARPVTINIDFHIGDIPNKKPDSEPNLEITVTDMLRKIGVPAHILGYGYLREAILLCVEDRDMISRITKTLYPTIAINHHTTSSRVERAIRHAIEVSWLRGNPDFFNEIFGYSISSEKGKPTNAEFIALLSDHILIGLKN